jgi:hypothetical protein
MAQQSAYKGNPIQDYVTVAERIEKFYERYPEGRIVTHIIEHDAERGFILMRAEVYRHPDDAQPSASGHAYEYRDAGYVQKTSYIEVGECVPMDTEILTIQGWKQYEELAIGELVASYDIGNDEMVWVPVQRKSYFENQALVRLFNPKGFEVFCTPNHTWAIEYRVKQERKCYLYRKLKMTRELKTVDSIIGSAPMYSGFLKTTPRDAALMGWAITDGWFQRQSPRQFRIGLGQSKANEIEMIRSLLTKVEHKEFAYEAHTRTFPSGKTYNCLPSIRWQLSAQSSRALLAAFNITHENQLPSVVPQLSFEARASMLEAMMLGDGTKEGKFGTKNRPWVMDVFSMLCALQGHVALKRRMSSTGEVPIQTLKRTHRIWASSLQQEEAGRADVWCPTVEHGTWVARFSNGVTVLTGNTSAVGRALALCGFEVKRGIASREEMEKQTRMAQPVRQPEREKVSAPAPKAGEPPAATAKVEKPVTPEKTAAAEKSSTEGLKEEILNLLETVRPQDRRAQRQLLVELTGKQTREELTYQEALQLIVKLKEESRKTPVEDDPLM